jgi:hypothetical protein
MGLTIVGCLSAREYVSFYRTVSRFFLRSHMALTYALSSRASDQFEAEIVNTACFTGLLEQP